MGAAITLKIIASTVSASKSLRPVRSPQSVTPIENTSDARVTRSPRICSGDMYAGLPFTTPERVAALLPSA